MITLKNEFLTVEISELGAEIQSIIDEKGVEYIWNGDPKYWTGRAPIMFPICGGLRDGEFIYEGKAYPIMKHGFAKTTTFTVEKADSTSVTFLTVSNDKTKEIYPFDYEFRVSFELSGKSVRSEYSVRNTGDKLMYMSFGAHEAYATPEGIEEYKLIFEKPETMKDYILDGELLRHDYLKLTDNSTEFNFADKYFEVDALVFKDIKSRYVTLLHKNGDRKIRLDFDGFNYFLLWHKYTAPYICLEPWCGVQDPVDSTKQLSTKEGINAIIPGDSFDRVHTITIGG